MKIGKMDKRITLQKPNTVSDGMGGKKPATGTDKWVDVVKLWAEFRTPNFKELVAAGTTVSELNQLISIWHRAGIERGWRILCGKRIFKIQNTFDPDKQTTLLVCQEVTK
jgi:SPP1 family predicted phage head-tail adaptor